MKKGIDYPGIFVCGICEDGKGNVLWRRRSAMARDEQGTWEPGAGGTLEHGETIVAALQREVKEETSADVLSHGYIGHFESFRELDGVSTHWIGFYFKCQVDPATVVLPNEEEADAMVWQSYHDAPTPTMSHFEEEYNFFKKHF
jgi:8-oxo-dGTP pyrophosphatase MutT (NUDIX family)